MQYIKNNSSNKENSNNQAASNMPIQHSKNEEIASSNIGGHRKNVEIISVISFMEETIETLKGFGEQLKIQLHSNLFQ